MERQRERERGRQMNQPLSPWPMKQQKNLKCESKKELGKKTPG